MALDKKALSKRMKKLWRDPEWRAMMEEHRRRTGLERRGIPCGDDTKALISATLMGHEVDDETREKIAHTLRMKGVPDGVDIPEGTKYCRKCEQVLPLDAFQKSSKLRDGRQTYCRECRTMAAKAKRNPPATKGEKVCTKCERLLPITEFYKRKDSPDGRAYICKECAKAKSTAWNQDHIEYKRQYQSQWQRDNPDLANARNHRYRARLLAAPGDGWTPEQWQAVLDHYAPDGKCLACGKKRKLTVDHVVMLQDGGANDISNVQPLCRRCNSRRESMDYRPDAGAYAQSLVRER